MSRNGIEPCEKSLTEGTECMCGLLPEGLPDLERDEGVRPNERCRLCNGTSDHPLYGLTRFGQPWIIEVCGVCGTVCNEY